MEERPGAPPPRKRVLRKALASGLLALAGLYLVLLIPDSDPVPPTPARRSPFAWNQDDHWKALEATFGRARSEDRSRLRERIRAMLQRAREHVRDLRATSREPNDPIFERLEEDVFALGALVGAAPEELADFIAWVSLLRDAAKEQSLRWDMNAPPVRARLYRLLYGARAAVEEVMLQAPAASVPALARGQDEPSQAPSAMVHGVRIHSGDILLSRGGAPTSALIARGNDFPGNFSHVALVHVDPSTSKVSLVEAHIEKGVAVASLDEYLADAKLRILVLRLRADHPALAKDPLLAHRVAAGALEEARSRHIPYDFAMDFNDPSKYFCSEVVSSAYRRSGVTLWMGLSTLSSPGVCTWLSAFGVRNSLTQEPSDLEYDPQLRVVAEWRDPELLSKDHLDNAIMDVRLEGAERGVTLGYSRALLPLARTMKAYSWVLNRFGGVGAIPEGMSATAALKLQAFRSRHAEMKALLAEKVDDFKRRRGYVPPYWEILRLAREIP